jgi:hypothetical protein
VERRRRPMRFDLAEMRLNGRGQRLRRNLLWGVGRAKPRDTTHCEIFTKCKPRRRKGGESRREKTFERHESWVTTKRGLGPGRHKHTHGQRGARQPLQNCPGWTRRNERNASVEKKRKKVFCFCVRAELAGVQLHFALRCCGDDVARLFCSSGWSSLFPAAPARSLTPTDCAVRGPYL